MASPCSESDRSVSSTWGNVAGGRETIAPWIASSTAVNKSRSFVFSPANCMNARTCSSGGSSRCSAHMLSSKSPWRSYARSRASTLNIRNRRMAPESDFAGITAIVPHQSNVTPLIVMDRLDVEDDLGDPFLRIHGEAVAGHGLDHEPQLVPILVDRLPARVTFERPSADVHVERREEESLGLVDVQQFPKPSEEERRKVVRLEAHLDLADGLHLGQVRDEAEHPLRGIREQFVQIAPVRADADVGGVLDFFVSHA